MEFCVVMPVSPLGGDIGFVDGGRRMAGEIGSHETDLFVDVQFAEYFGCVEEMLVVEDPSVPRC